MSKLIFKSNWLPFLILLLSGCYLSSQLMFDVLWDFTNYHYYNAFAFLNGRLGYDIVPSSINTYLNPLMEIPFYYMVEYLNDYPKMVHFIQGGYFGLLLFIFFKINLLFFDTTKIKNQIFIALSLLIATTGYATWFQIGSTTNEIQIALLVMISLYLLLKEIFILGQQRKFIFFIAGLILGIALGLKATAVIYCLSLGFTLIIFYKKLSNPWKMIYLFTLGGLLGYLLINGYFMWVLWEKFQNPFFPFLNAVFKSEYFDDFNYRDERYLPTSFLQALAYPYLWAYHFKSLVSEFDFVDIRFAVVYTILIGFIVRALYTRRFKIYIQENLMMSFLIVFMILSYIIWLKLFAIMRYLVPIEMLSAIIIIKTLGAYRPKKAMEEIIYFVLLIFMGMLFYRTTLDSINFGRRIGSEKIIEIEELDIPEGSLIKLYNFPSAALIPIFEKKAKVRALGYSQYNGKYMKGSDFAERGKTKELRDKIEREHKGPVVIIYRENYNPIYGLKILEAMDANNLNCRKLENNLDNGLYICESKGKVHE